MRPGTRARAGFTLLEVMVAVAILALSLTAIFSSEAGAIKMAHRARKMGTATLLARCKMGEIEEQIASQGLPAVFDSGNDSCCEDAPIDGYTCDWEIDPIVLPDNMFAPPEDANGSQDLADNAQGSTQTGSSSTTPAGAAQPGALPAVPPGAAAALPGLAAGAATPGATGSTDPLAAYRNMDPATMLSGGGMGGLASLAMSFVYPVLKPAFESQIRRATVTIHWKEGSSEHSFDVTQYVVSDQPAAPTPEQLQQLQQSQQQGAVPGAGALPGGAALPGQLPASQGLP